MTHGELQEGKLLISIYLTRLFLAAIFKASNFKFLLVQVYRDRKKEMSQAHVLTSQASFSILTKRHFLHGNVEEVSQTYLGPKQTPPLLPKESLWKELLQLKSLILQLGIEWWIMELNEGIPTPHEIPTAWGICLRKSWRYWESE